MIELLIAGMCIGGIIGTLATLAVVSVYVERQLKEMNLL